MGRFLTRRRAVVPRQALDLGIVVRLVGACAYSLDCSQSRSPDWKYQ